VTTGNERAAGRHAVVVGMHRSGTSAVANVMARLGLALPDESDLITPGPYNERGYWESRRFVTYDDRVLRHLGGTWSAPPAPAPAWERADDVAMAELRAGAREFARVEFTDPHLVLKDPRLCITLPLWRTVLEPPPVAVLVLRDPLEVARSLEHRNDFPLSLSLALWRRYVQQSVTAVEGLPVLVVEYGELLRDPTRSVGALASFLAEQGLPVDVGVPEAVEALAPDLRHHRDHADDGHQALGSVLSEQREFAAALVRHGGAEKWSPPPLPPEPGWVGDLIELVAAGEMVTFAHLATRHELRNIKRSRLFGATRAIWRATSSGPALSEDAEIEGATGTPSGASAPTNGTERSGSRPWSETLGRWSGTARNVVRNRGRTPAGGLPHEDNPDDPSTLDEFLLMAVIKSWMDEDVIGATVQNLKTHGFDAVYLVDNASTDATVANGVKAGAEVAEVYETEAFDGRLVQPFVNAVVARESLRSRADHVWWLLLDSDEFPEGPGGMSLRQYLSGLDRRFRVVGASFVNHVPSSKPEYVEGFHPIDFQPLCYPFEPANHPPCPLGHWKHPLQRFDRHGQFVLSNDGAHTAYASERLVEPSAGIVTHHFQYRDEKRTRDKLELVCGTSSPRVGLHQSAGFSGFTRRKRSLDAVYARRWTDMDVLPNAQASASRRPQPWPRVADVLRWYPREEAEAARRSSAEREQEQGQGQERERDPEHPSR
jgi:Glycosyl transferase family 2/Sulfotransferase family